jgi:NAD(P)-dependent dehydrogenase (short-subunit alcohol dehydrogenase family)
MMSETAARSPPEPSPSFQGRVALVLGASRGIGAATAREFAHRGARVVLASRDLDALDRVAREIADSGGDALALPADLADPASLTRLFARTEESFGRLDCAFNNAGEGSSPTPLAEIPPELFERVLRVTVEGTFRALREEIPRILRTGGGAIVNMASTAGMSGFAGGGAYVTAKHAILGLTKSAALDYAAAGLRVNAVAPGPIETERLRSLPEPVKELRRAAVPMRRVGLPEEVATVVTWLCSDDARFVTGATILVDGGRLAGSA